MVNSIARITEPFRGETPSGLTWASFTGKYRLAPWLVRRTYASGGDALQPGDSVYDLFVCPSCHAS